MIKLLCASNLAPLRNHAAEQSPATLVDKIHVTELNGTLPLETSIHGGCPAVLQFSNPVALQLAFQPKPRQAVGLLSCDSQHDPRSFLSYPSRNSNAAATVVSTSTRECSAQALLLTVEKEIKGHSGPAPKAAVGSDRCPIWSLTGSICVTPYRCRPGANLVGCNLFFHMGLAKPYSICRLNLVGTAAIRADGLKQ